MWSTFENMCRGRLVAFESECVRLERFDASRRSHLRPCVSCMDARAARRRQVGHKVMRILGGARSTRGEAVPV